jgi:hypothetical protein
VIDGDCEYTNKAECAMIAATGTIGPGAWTVHRASLALGYGINHVGQPDDTHMRIVPGTELDTSGTIDSGVTAPTPEQDQDTASTWNIDAARMQLKRAVNLGEWDITRELDDNTVTEIHVTEYMEARTVRVEEEGYSQHPNICVFSPEGITPHGLRVLQLLQLKGVDIYAHGAYVKSGDLVVQRKDEEDPAARVTMEGASQLRVDILSHESSNDLLAEFRDGSSLNYGVIHENREPDDDPEYRFYRNWLDIIGRENDDTVLLFEDTSFIAGLADVYPPYEHYAQDLLITLTEADFRIQSTVSESPAWLWFTGDADVDFAGGAPAEVEVISQDSCNLWFTDVPEPRCLKYWRNIVATGADVTLVDDHDNHVCGDEPDPPDGALYVIDTIDEYGQEIEVNGIQVYYGAYDGQESANVTGTPAPVRLCRTGYGDFDLDCDIDEDDYDFIVNYLYGVLSRCDWPVADYDGDCLVDLTEVAEVLDREGTLISVCDSQCTLYCDGYGDAPGGGDGPQQGGEQEIEYIPGTSGEAVAAFANAVLGYLLKQDPQDSGPEDTVQHMIDSFDKLTAMYFDADQKAALADSLEKADYASDTVADLAAALVTKLRG